MTEKDIEKSEGQVKEVGDGTCDEQAAKSESNNSFTAENTKHRLVINVA